MATHTPKPRRMTAQKWLTYPTHLGMIKFLRRRASHRKKRLFAVACCRLIWSIIPDERLRKAVEISEAFADAMVTETQRRIAAKAADDALLGPEGELLSRRLARRAAVCSIRTTERTANFVVFSLAALKRDRPSIPQNADVPIWTEAMPLTAQLAEEERVVCDILREVAHPFGTTILDLSWRSTTAMSLADTIYRERAFDILPVLADALMDSGCTDPSLLQHLQSPGPHVRGCWALDLILGKD